MTANYSSAARTREYQPTILETKSLLARLAVQIAFARSELRGVGPGFRSNTGGGWGQTGCCGDGTGEGRGGPGGSGGSDFAVRVFEVDQRARLLSKPEPQYTEEARRNQVTGSVMLRAVFASTGEVVQIRALSALPFGLTERPSRLRARSSLCRRGRTGGPYRST